MPTSRDSRFRALFQSILVTAGAASTAGCGSSITPSDFATNVCDGELAGVTPGTPVDYLEVRSSLPLGDPGETPRTTATRGVPCASATDVDACKQRLAALRPTDLQSPKAIDHFDGRYVVFTRGDEVGAVTTRQGLVEFLSPFESAKDGALFLQEFTEHSISCDGANARPAGGGFEFRTTAGHTCGPGAHKDAHVVFISEAGEVVVRESERLKDGDPNCMIGRRPEGFAPARAGVAMGDQLAVLFQLEAASVPAFLRLARELRAYGAPDSLVRRAKSAALDEVRHARMMRRLAKRFGVEPSSPRVGALAVRPLVDVARENTREGCVRETFGALVASFQARRAADPEVRSVLGEIAEDETRHAAFSWDVAVWLDSQLAPAEREATRHERASAYAELYASLAEARGPSLAEARDALRSSDDPEARAASLLGRPSADEERALLVAMEAALRDEGGLA